MGRPRKRRAAEEPVTDDASTDSSRPPVSHTPGGVSLQQQDPLINTALDFLPQLGPDANVNYLDMLPNNFGDNDSAQLYSLAPQPYNNPIFGPGDDSFGNNAFQIDFSGADMLQGIDFNEPELTGSSISKDINDSLQQYVAGHIPPPEETPPSISSGISSTVESPEPPHDVTTLKPLPNTSCGCLSSLYLALESLTHLPSDVPSAMRVTRSATKVAQDVLDCHHCSQFFFKDPLQPQPVQAFQNMMCLGALVPSACNAYANILEMVDRETDIANKSQKQIFFSFRELGGYWGFVMDDKGACSALKAYDNKNLSPDVWRTTVRSILKLDVYGLGGKTGDSPPGRQPQRGLKDIVNELDKTARLRHEMMDDLVAAGKAPQHHKYMIHCHKPVPPEQRNCARVIESARMALNNLIIS